MTDTAPTVSCVRCQRQAPAVVDPAYPGPLGDEIRAKVCADCWSEWQAGEVMVINELRLNFMDPKSQDILVRHMREFLALDGPPKPGGGLPPKQGETAD